MNSPGVIYKPQAHHEIFIKWTALVLLNAAFGLMMNLKASPAQAAGMFAAIATFVLIYATLDIYLQEKRLHKWQRALLAGVLLKALIQLLPVIDMMAGAIAVDLVMGTTTSKAEGGFIQYYLTTLVDGFLLSLVVGCFSLLARLIMRLLEQRKSRLAIANEELA